MNSRVYERYNNFKLFLEEIGYEFNCEPTKLKLDDRIAFTCGRGHITDIRVSSFGTKKALYFSKKKAHFCDECNYFDDTYAKVLKVHGHKILTLEKERKCTYICGSCGSEAKSFTPNLMRNDENGKFCKNCVYRNRKDVDVARPL